MNCRAVIASRISTSWVSMNCRAVIASRISTSSVSNVCFACHTNQINYTVSIKQSLLYILSLLHTETIAHRHHTSKIPILWILKINKNLRILRKVNEFCYFHSASQSCKVTQWSQVKITVCEIIYIINREAVITVNANVYACEKTACAKVDTAQQ